MPRRPRHYYLPSEDGFVSAAQLKKLGNELQIEIMRHWFANLFDPPDELPYDSSEGGYQWIWGAPVEPKEQLEGEFGSLVSEAAIDELSASLEEVGYEWSPKPQDDDFDIDITELDPYYTLVASLIEIQDTAKRKRSKTDAPIIHRLLFANIVSALETYLGDTFGKMVIGNHEYLEDFVLKSGHFQEQKIPLSQIFKRSKTIDAEALAYIDAHNWHRLGESAKMYNRAFGVVFPEAARVIHDGIRDRHDIIHRNGKSKDGVVGSWGVAEILALKEAVLGFATSIEDQMKKLSATDLTASDDILEI
jgi:hypothetical protein